MKKLTEILRGIYHRKYIDDMSLFVESEYDRISLIEGKISKKDSCIDQVTYLINSCDKKGHNLSTKHNQNKEFKNA